MAYPGPFPSGCVGISVLVPAFLRVFFAGFGFLLIRKRFLWYDLARLIAGSAFNLVQVMLQVGQVIFGYESQAMHLRAIFSDVTGSFVHGGIHYTKHPAQVSVQGDPQRKQLLPVIIAIMLKSYPIILVVHDVRGIFILGSDEPLKVVLRGVDQMSQYLAPAPFVGVGLPVEFCIADSPDARDGLSDGILYPFRDGFHTSSTASSAASAFTMSNSILKLSIMKSWRS